MSLGLWPSDLWREGTSCAVTAPTPCRGQDPHCAREGPLVAVLGLRRREHLPQLSSLCVDLQLGRLSPGQRDRDQWLL